MLSTCVHSGCRRLLFSVSGRRALCVNVTHKFVTWLNHASVPKRAASVAVPTAASMGAASDVLVPVALRKGLS